MTPATIFPLIAGGVLAAFLLSRYLATRGVPRIDPVPASEKVRAGLAVFLDVRRDAERRTGTIQGSVHIPLHEMGGRSAELRKFGTKEIICFCQSGSRSLSAAARLRKLGIPASSLQGGIGEWNFAHRVRR
jgi:rhodanese-related sulfurtransferase